MSMVGKEMDMGNVIVRVAEFMDNPAADPAGFCHVQMDRAVEDDDLTALIFWRSVAKRLTP